MKKLLIIITLIGLIAINTKIAQATSCDKTDCKGNFVSACQDANNKIIQNTYKCPPPPGAQGSSDDSGSYQASPSVQCMTFVVPKKDPCHPNQTVACGDQFMILNSGASE